MERLRFSIDLVGEHSLDDALGLFAGIQQAARDAVDPGVRVELLATHDHAVGCDFCTKSIADPTYCAGPLNLR